MATKTELIECVVCREYLSDPRALPCGHSFCGPPRVCLSSMEKAKGGICCAVCRTDHNLKAEDIKPLYGIRDFIQGVSESQSTERQRLPCSNHRTKDCSLWCISCDVMICVECVGYLHDGHPVRTLKSHLVEKLELRFGKSFREGMKEYSDDLETDLTERKYEIEKVKDQFHALEAGLFLAQQLKQLVDDVVNALSTETVNETSMDETAFVVKLLKIESLYLNIGPKNEAVLSSRSDYEKTPSARIERKDEVGSSSVATYSEGHSVSATESATDVALPEALRSDCPAFPNEYLSLNSSFASASVVGGQSEGEAFESKLTSQFHTWHKLVIEYSSQGRYEEAIRLCKQALEDLESQFGHNHPDVANMLNILALIYRDQGKITDATDLLHDSLAIRESTLGEDHPSVAVNLNNLTVLYGRRGRYREAEPLCKRALEIREKILCPNHPDMAKQLNNLALLCQNQDRYAEAEILYRRALCIYEEAAPNTEDSNVVKTKNNLAIALIKQNKWVDAENICKGILKTEFKFNTAESASLSMGAEAATASKNSSNRESDAARMRSISLTLKKLAMMYRKRGKGAAAKVLLDYSIRAENNELDDDRINRLREILDSN